MFKEIRQHTKEIIMIVLLLMILACVIRPCYLWMPSKLMMSLAVLFLVMFSIFAVFVWREKAADEREQFHNMLAGRAAFLIGSGVLSFALVAQSINHTTDPWIALALGAMILTKLCGIIWARNKQ